MLVLVKLYIVPVCVGFSFAVAVAALMGVLVPDLDAARAAVALAAGVMCGLAALATMRRDEVRGYRSWQ